MPLTARVGGCAICRAVARRRGGQSVPAGTSGRPRRVLDMLIEIPVPRGSPRTVALTAAAGEGADLPTGTAERIYGEALRALSGARAPFLVGGAYAFLHYTGIDRRTQDFDVFLREADVPRSLRALARGGFRTEVLFPHWLAKAHRGEHYLDLIYSSGNGLAPVDDAWFRRSVPAEVLGLPVRLVAAEEMIWQKAFIQERERFDGADVLHLIRARAESLDWPRLIARFGCHWRVLLAHLVLFGYVYPTERQRVPASVMRHLFARLRGELDRPAPGPPLCQGTLLSREQYLSDLERGYLDARREPHGPMSDDDIAIWTEAIGSER